MHLNITKRGSRLRVKFLVVVFTTIIYLMIASPFVLVEKAGGFRLGLNIARAYDFSESLNNIAKKSGFDVVMGTGEDFGLLYIISSVIYSGLALLGVVFLIIAIIAGYRWMMAGGNEETVARARKTLSRAAIGVLIVMGAYAITYYVVSNLL